MKKQNVNNKLSFNRAAVIELNDGVLENINGGSFPTFTAVIDAVTVTAVVVSYYAGLIRNSIR